MEERRDNIYPIAPGAQVSRVGDRVEIWEFSATTEGGALISAGLWLNERHGTSDERTVESVNWWLGPEDEPLRYVLRLTLSRFPNSGE